LDFFIGNDTWEYHCGKNEFAHLKGQWHEISCPWNGVDPVDTITIKSTTEHAMAICGVKVYSPAPEEEEAEESSEEEDALGTYFDLADEAFEFAEEYEDGDVYEY
jgi:hypothetical protein